MPPLMSPSAAVRESALARWYAVEFSEDIRTQ
jgi:hypothetical protein